MIFRPVRLIKSYILLRIEIATKQIQYYQPPTQWSYCARIECIENSNIKSSSLKIFILFLFNYLSCATSTTEIFVKVLYLRYSRAIHDIVLVNQRNTGVV